MDNLSDRAGLIRKNIVGLFSKKGSGLVLAFLILCVFLTFANENFLTIGNFMIVIRQAVFIAIIGYGMTLVLGIAGIDLSVGSIMGLVAFVLAYLISTGTNIYLSILIVLVLGVFIGTINGVIIAKFHIPDFITTMAMMSILRGVLKVCSRGFPICGIGYKEFTWIAQGYVGFIPIPVIIALVLFIVFYYLLYKTSFGRYVMCIGSSSESARLVGVNVARIKIKVYAICGLLAAFAGIMMTARLEASTPELGLNYEMQVIGATVIGGTSLAGGSASLFGTALGAVFMTVITNGLNLLNINTLWQQVVVGVTILIAVGLDVLSSRRLKKD